MLAIYLPMPAACAALEQGIHRVCTRALDLQLQLRAFTAYCT